MKSLLLILFFAMALIPSNFAQVTETDVGVINTMPNFDPTSATSWIDTWTWWYTITVPVGTWLLSLIWPSNTKKTLTLKASSFAIFVIAVVLMYKGIDSKNVLNAVFAFFMQWAAYDKFLQPLGMSSPKKYVSKE